MAVASIKNTELPTYPARVRGIAKLSGAPYKQYLDFGNGPVPVVFSTVSVVRSHFLVLDGPISMTREGILHPQFVKAYQNYSINDLYCSCDVYGSISHLSDDSFIVAGRNHQYSIPCFANERALRAGTIFRGVNGFIDAVGVHF